MGPAVRRRGPIAEHENNPLGVQRRRFQAGFRPGQQILRRDAVTQHQRLGGANLRNEVDMQAAKRHQAAVKDARPAISRQWIIFDRAGMAAVAETNIMLADAVSAARTHKARSAIVGQSGQRCRPASPVVVAWLRLSGNRTRCSE